MPDSRFSIFRILLLLVLVLWIPGGCTLSPHYTRPDAPIPNLYPSASVENGVDLPPWESFFKDPPLCRVIGLALENNRDLRVSLLNIEKTRAQYRIQRADLLPSINAVGEAANQHLPADLSNTGEKGVFRQYSATLGFSAFELDLFGRIRSLTTQALETYYSVEEEANAARISLMAETAAMYLQLVADREMYDLTAATYENRKETYDLMKSQFAAGVISDLDVVQAKSLLEDARVNLAMATTQVNQDQNALALLMGTPIPADLPEIRRISHVTLPTDLPEGLPASLLERRPDIRAAEHVLMGANANIGAARANFFPTLSLTGAFGKMSADYDRLWEGVSRAWVFTPQIAVPIFDMGRNRARLKMSEAERDMAVARYEKAIQTAFREVADTLVQRDTIQEQLDAQSALVAAIEKRLSYSEIRYGAGIGNFLDVLDSRRSLYGAQNTLISYHLLEKVNALTLYKALGGGWDETTDEAREGKGT